jgi:phage/plasmid-like protein (TIGR03299 family)
MSHEIDMSNDRANIAYIGDPPWHSLGNPIEPGQTIEEWKIAAGMGWLAERRPVYFKPYDTEANADMHPVERNKLVAFPNRSVLVRSDTLSPLSIVSENKFNIFQPGEVLDFYEGLVDGTRYTLETAGCLKGGKIVWALAKCNLDVRIMGQDLINPYLYFSTAFDGTSSTVADLTGVRVVCWNTMQMAVGKAGEKALIRIPHMTKITDKVIQKVKDDMGLLDDAIEIWAKDVDTMAETKVPDVDGAVNYFVEVFGKRGADGKLLQVQDQAKSLEKLVNGLIAKWKNGDGSSLASARGTVWGLVNAVTAHVDHDTRARSTESRFVSAQSGAGRRVKAKAFEEGLKLAA